MSSEGIRAVLACFTPVVGSHLIFVRKLVQLVSVVRPEKRNSSPCGRRISIIGSGRRRLRSRVFQRSARWVISFNFDCLFFWNVLFVLKR